jgi:hypothetical protein
MSLLSSARKQVRKRDRSGRIDIRMSSAVRLSKRLDMLDVRYYLNDHKTSQIASQSRSGDDYANV